MSRAARPLIFLVRAYQTFFSALMPSACKFYPSCSNYAAEALRLHGARRGSWLALRRLLRCHPFTRGGVDVVPGPSEFSAGSLAPSAIPSPVADGQAFSAAASFARHSPLVTRHSTKEVHS